MKSSSDLTPLPRWRQKRAAMVAWWRRSRDSRRTAYQTLRNAGASFLTFAYSLLGGILVSFGVWCIYPPAGYIVGGLVCWLLEWSREGRGE